MCICALSYLNIINISYFKFLILRDRKNGKTGKLYILFSFYKILFINLPISWVVTSCFAGNVNDLI